MWLSIKRKTGNRNLLLNVDNIIAIYTGGIEETLRTIFASTTDGKFTKIGDYESKERAEKVYKMLVEEIMICAHNKEDVFEVPEK